MNLMTVYSTGLFPFPLILCSLSGGGGGTQQGNIIAGLLELLIFFKVQIMFQREFCNSSLCFILNCKAILGSCGLTKKKKGQAKNW